MLPIVQRGISQVIEVVQRSNGDLDAVGEKIRALGEEYELLGNQRLAMDLYNNEVGRNIAAANPDAGPEQLADLVEQAVKDGDTVVVRADGKGLEWTDRIDTEDIGTGQVPPVPGEDPDTNPYPGY